MTLVPPADAAIGADAPVLTAEPLNQSSGDDVPSAATVPAPPAPDLGGDVLLVLSAPWQLDQFDPSVIGWDPITPGGTFGPSATSAQVIAVGATYGVTIESR